MQYATGQVFSRFPALQPTKELYGVFITLVIFVDCTPLCCFSCTAVFSDGRSANLLSLKGTIPTVVQGITYHTPVIIHLPPDFPRMPPIAYVTPTHSEPDLFCAVERETCSSKSTVWKYYLTRYEYVNLPL